MKGLGVDRRREREKGRRGGGRYRCRKIKRKGGGGEGGERGGDIRVKRRRKEVSCIKACVSS